MRRKFLVLILLMMLSSCGGSAPKEKGCLLDSIFVATDLHLLSNNLVPEKGKYTKDLLTSDGRVQEADYQILEALIEEVNQEKPSYLMLTGDLTFNGEYDSHVELVKYLNMVNENTKVLVIPGNHDIFNTRTFRYFEDEFEYLIENTSDVQFKELYQNFGYQGALSYDQDSLSYFYKMSDKKWALMLDTNLTEYNYFYEDNTIGGYLDDTTLNWIEDNLKKAKENNVEVISFSHHNLLTHNELFERLYTMQNAEELLDVYEKYNVKLNFSGHLHIRSNKSARKNKIRDISNQSLLDYGNRYTRLDIYENCYALNSTKLNVEYPNVDDFNSYSFDAFYKKYYNKSLMGFESRYPNDYLEVAAFAAKVNCYYFDGDYQEIHNLSKQHKKVAKLLKSKKNGNDYIKSILKVENKDQNHLEIYY